MHTYGNFIQGKWTKPRTTFSSLNPSSGRSIGNFAASTEREVDRAVEAAQNALEKWKNTPAPKRGEILLRAAQILRDRKIQMGKLVSREMGKVLSEGLGDVQEAIDTLEYFAGEGRRLFGHTTPSELPEKTAFTRREPVGVVGMITPWNFPLAIPSWKLAPALVCGNTVVFKPASDTPLNAIAFVKILEQAGIPKGVLNVVTGSGHEVGTPIINHPDIDALSFTGSREVGRLVASEAGAHLKKVGLELGGKNAITVMDDADLTLAVEGILWGAFGTTGQRCTATSRVIVHKNITRKLTRTLLDKTKRLKLGDPLKKGTDIGPLINRRQRDRVQSYVEIGKDEARLVCGGESANHGKLANGAFYKPTIFTDVTSDMTIAQEEIFGPVLSIIEVNNLDEAIDVNNNAEYGLSSAVYTRSVNNAFHAIEHMDTGIVYINSSTIGAEVHLPFGGTKGTGNGTREAGIEGIHEFSETKTVYIDYSGTLQKAQGIN